MQIINVDLIDESLVQHDDLVKACKEIINENLRTNGGTLKIADIFERDFKWTNLVVVIVNNQVVGFALVRESENKHNLKEASSYYYLSDIVVKKEFRNQGIGELILKTVISSIGDDPLVASVLKDNLPSIRFLLKCMKCYSVSDSGKYYRFVDAKTYDKLYGEEINDVLVGVDTDQKSSKRM